MSKVKLISDHTKAPQVLTQHTGFVPNKNASGCTSHSVIGTTNPPWVTHQTPDLRGINYMSFKNNDFSLVTSSCCWSDQLSQACNVLHRSFHLIPSPFHTTLSDRQAEVPGSHYSQLAFCSDFFLSKRREKKWVGSVWRVAQPCLRACPINTPHRKARNMKR